MIAFDSFGQSDASGSTGGTNPFNFTNTAGNFLIIGVMNLGLGDNVDSAGAFYGGQQLTQLYSNLDTARNLWVGYLVNPPTGTNSLSINWTGGTPVSFRIGCITFTGVDPVSPIGGSNSTVAATGTSTPISTTVTVTGASGVVVDAIVISACDSGNAQAPQIEEMNNTGTWAGGGNNLGGMSYVAHSGSNVTMTWENLVNQTGSTRKQMYAVELLPKAASTFVAQAMVI